MCGRWDLAEDLAFKAEIIQATDHSDQAVKALLGESFEATVISMSVDYVF